MDHLLPTIAFELIDPARVQHWIEVGGPLMIFVLLFTCGLGLPVPEDIPLILGGFFVAHDNWNLPTVAVLAWLGILGGDCLLYRFGRKYGRNVSKVPFIGKHVTEKRILKAEQLFERWGVWVVAFGRLFAGIRGAMVVAAGATRFSFVKFIIADGLAAMVSGGIFVALGYYLGQKAKNLDEVRKQIKPYEHWVIGGIIAAVVAAIIYLWWRETRHKGVTDVALETAAKVAQGGPKTPAIAEPAEGTVL